MMTMNAIDRSSGYESANHAGMMSSLLQERLRAGIEARADRPVVPPAPMMNRLTGLWFCTDCGLDLEPVPGGGWMCRGLGVRWPRPDLPAAWFPIPDVHAETGTRVDVHGQARTVIRLTVTDSDGMVRRVVASFDAMERVYHRLGEVLGR